MRLRRRYVGNTYQTQAKNSTKAAPIELLVESCPVTRKATRETSMASARASGAMATVIRNDA